MAADRAEIERLIRAADAAGDGAAVQVLFGELDKLDQTPQAPVLPAATKNPADLVPLPGGRVAQDGQEVAAPQNRAPVSTPDIWDKAKADFGHAGRSMVPILRGSWDAITALPGLAADAGISARNLITGSNYPGATALSEQSLDQIAPMPNLPGADALRLGTSLVAGGALPTATKLSRGTQLAPEGFQTAKQTAINANQAAARVSIEEGKKRGVPVFADDVIQNSMLRRASVAAEQVPVIGTSSGRAAQGQAAQAAVKSTVEKFSDEMSDDIPVAVQKSMGRRLGQFKDAAGKLYDKVAARLDPAGEVQTPTLAKAIQEKIDAETKLGSVANKEVLALLEKYKTAPAGNFSMMREIRSQLGSDISDFYTGANKTIGAKGVGSLQAIKNALETDMRAFANAQGPESARLWKAADSFYKTNIAKFKEAGLRDLVKTSEPEKVWRYIVAQGGLKSRSDKVFATLDNAGKQAVRAGLLKEAQEAATTQQGGQDIFSPAKFAKYIEDHDVAVQAFFKGRDLQEIKGLSNLMRTVQRAGQFAENPPTGQRVIPYLLATGAGAGAVASPVGTAATAGGVYGFTKLLQTESGRNLLLLMAKTKPGSEGAERLAAQAAKLAMKTGPVATQAATREE